MALTEEQREIALTVNRSMDKRNAFGNFEAFCVEFAARFLAALPKQEPVYYQWRRKADPWSTSFIFSNEAKATSDDSEVRQLYTEATIAQPASEQKPATVPFGWKLVPTTVTDEMHVAARIARVEGESTWQAMLNAAPEYPDSQPDHKAQRDAERYRWLREQHWNESNMCVVLHPKNAVRLGHECPSDNRLDAYIDAAIASVKGGE